VQITIDGKQISAIEPKPTYSPLFATMPLNSKSGYCESESPPSPPKKVVFRIDVEAFGGDGLNEQRVYQHKNKLIEGFTN